MEWVGSNVEDEMDKTYIQQMMVKNVICTVVPMKVVMLLDALTTEKEIAV